MGAFIHLTVYCYVTYVHIPRSSVYDRSNRKIRSAALTKRKYVEFEQSFDENHSFIWYKDKTFEKFVENLTKRCLKLQILQFSVNL